MEFLKEAFSLSGIINGLIVAIVFELLRNKVNLFPSLTIVDRPSKPNPGLPVSKVQRNREILFNAVFYFMTYMMIYFAITMPAYTKAYYCNYTVFLSDAKRTGFLLPDIEITRRFFQWKLAALAIGVYIFLFLLINCITLYLIIPAIGLIKERIERLTKLKINGGLFVVTAIFLIAFGFSEFFNISFKFVLIITVLLVLGVITEATYNNKAKSS